MDDCQIARICRLEQDAAAFRATSLEDRGKLLEAACRAAMEIERGRLASGLPPSQPAPWPESTWELLRRHAPLGRQ